MGIISSKFLPIPQSVTWLVPRELTNHNLIFRFIWTFLAWPCNCPERLPLGNLTLQAMVSAPRLLFTNGFSCPRVKNILWAPLKFWREIGYLSLLFCYSSSEIVSSSIARLTPRLIILTEGPIHLWRENHSPPDPRSIAFGLFVGEGRQICNADNTHACAHTQTPNALLAWGMQEDWNRKRQKARKH